MDCCCWWRSLPRGCYPLERPRQPLQPLEVIGMTSAYPEPYQAKTSDSLNGLGLEGPDWERGWGEGVHLELAVESKPEHLKCFVC